MAFVALRVEVYLVFRGKAWFMHAGCLKTLSLTDDQLLLRQAGGRLTKRQISTPRRRNVKAVRIKVFALYV